MPKSDILPARPAGFSAGLATQAATLRALMLRGLQQRFGRNNIGYLWVIGEPMLLASVVTLLHSAVAGHGNSGISPFTFMLTGYGIYCIFRNSFNRAEGLLHGSEALLYHRMITPFDIVTANLMVETIGCVAAIAMLQVLGIMVGVSEWPARPLYLIASICLFTWFSFGMNLVIAAYAYRSPIISRLAHPFSYFLLPVSGAFITMSILPSWTRPLLAWNPMMTVFEMARYGQFHQAKDTYVYGGYAVAASVMLTYWGMVEIRRVRKYIHVP